MAYTDDPFEAQEMQEELQTKYTGGTVLHLYMNERISYGHRLQGARAPFPDRLPQRPTSPSRRPSPSAPSTATWPAST